MRITTAVVGIAIWGFVLTSTSTAQTIEVQTPLVKLSRSIDASAAESGLIREVLVGEGDSVERGQLLARLEAGEAAAILQRAQVELEIARMDAASDVNIREAQHELVFAEAESARAEQSSIDFPGSFTESELEAKALAVSKAKIALERANLERERLLSTLRLREREVALAQLRVDRFNVYSEIDGEVAHVSHLAGEWVEQGRTLVRVVNNERLRAEGFLETNDYRPGLRGAQVLLDFELVGGDNLTIRCELGYLSPENDPHNNEIRVWAEFDNAAQLIRAGMEPRMRIRLPASR